MADNRLLTPGEYATVAANSDVLLTRDEIESAYHSLAVQLDKRFEGTLPVILPVMMGGLIPAVGILRHLSIPHRLDYVHTSRYGHAEAGGELNWKVPPSSTLIDQDVVVVDDIFDQGTTLAAVVGKLRELPVASVTTVVLARKIHDRVLTSLRPDLIGVEVPDRFVFGCGLDYHGGLRHLPDLHAIAE
ncbi:MAG: hypoxanthine-guanine phosphoribosyltransferase [Gammaproteobacteria bacterium]